MLRLVWSRFKGCQTLGDNENSFGDRLINEVCIISPHSEVVGRVTRKAIHFQNLCTFDTLIGSWAFSYVV